MKDFLLNENFSMMDIPSDHLIPLDSTGVLSMSRTLKLTFNVENRTFDVGYLNYDLNSKETRSSKVHCYYLSIDTRLSQFIEFLVFKYPTQASQVKINNVRQVTLKKTVNSSNGLVYYNLIITGDSTGIMTFQPSEFLDSKREVETDLSSLEPLINSIINEEEEKSCNLLRFQLNEPNRLTTALRNFTANYSDYDYFRDKGNHIYNLFVDSNTLELVEFLRNHYPRLNSSSSEIDEVYVRVSEKKKVASVIIYGIDNSEYEQIDFVPGLLEDSDPSNSLPQFHLTSNKTLSKNKSTTEKIATTSDIKQQVISVCKEIADSRVQTTQKIDELRELLTSLSLIEEKNEPKKIKEIVHKVYKQVIGDLHCVYVGTKTLNDEIVFKLPNWSEEERKILQSYWKTYHSGFTCQTEIHYDDETIELGDRLEFTPTNKIQEIESSDRKGVIGYVARLGGLVEVIYYDRFVSLFL